MFFHGFSPWLLDPICSGRTTWKEKKLCKRTIHLTDNQEGEGEGKGGKIEGRKKERARSAQNNITPQIHPQ